jgi:hypothetical protein
MPKRIVTWFRLGALRRKKLRTLAAISQIRRSIKYIKASNRVPRGIKKLEDSLARYRRQFHSAGAEMRGLRERKN